MITKILLCIGFAFLSLAWVFMAIDRMVKQSLVFVVMSVICSGTALAVFTTNLVLTLVMR